MTNVISEPAIGDFPQKVVNVDASIANGAQISAILDLGGCVPVGIYLPAVLTGTAITFKASPDGTSLSSLFNGTTALSVTFEASAYIALDYTKFLGCRYLQVSTGANEAAARTITLATRPI